jgi:hypothetical protein
LDVDTTNQSSPELLDITAIHGGAAETWNTSNPAKEIRVGDKIAKVNHVQGDRDSMLAEVRNSSHLIITILRPREAEKQRRQSVDSAASTCPPRSRMSTGRSSILSSLSSVTSREKLQREQEQRPEKDRLVFRQALIEVVQLRSVEDQRLAF